jgi:ribosomal protein S18 acetylase RimI-like enzyme
VSRSPEHLARIEQHAVQAWPAPNSQDIDGWLLRHTPGMKRLRASGAALPLSSATRLCSSLHLVEAFYADRNVPAAVQVSPATDQTELDQQLAARGYRFRAPIRVLTAPTDIPMGASGLGIAWDVDVNDRPTADWLNAFVEFDDHDDSAHVAEQVISKISLPTGHLSVRVDNRIVGMGLIVGGDDQWAGIYCMATHPDHRRQGMGRAVLRAGTHWAIDHGAVGLYLQVERANAAAQRMYTTAGFFHAYDYHYRVASHRGHE